MCPFDDAEDFAAAFAADELVKLFNAAVCKHCDWKTARDRGVDCAGAKQSMCRLMRKCVAGQTYDGTGLHILQEAWGKQLQLT